MAFLDPTSLVGALVRLDPLTHADASELAVAVAEGDLGESPLTSTPTPAAMAADVARKIAEAERRQRLPFAIRRLDGSLVGVTTYLNPLPAIPAVEIGATWIARGAQRTGINTEMKYLMLTHAFDTWGCRRVALRTAWLNQQSRAAIERLGAAFEGRIRNDRLTRDGLVTDTAQYALTDADWSVVRHHLEGLLAETSPSR